MPADVVRSKTASVSDVYDQALAYMETGKVPTLPRGGMPSMVPYGSGKPRLALDYGGAKYDVKVVVQGDVAVFSGTVRFGTQSGAGFHLGQDDAVVRYMKHITDAPDAHVLAEWDRALHRFARDHVADIEALVRKTLFGADTYRLYSEAFGHGNHDAGEYGPPENVRLDIKFDADTRVSAWERSVPFTLRFSFEAKRKEAVNERPLSALSDRQLDAVIEEVLGPEGVYADGEIPRSQMPARRRMLRQQYRNKSPREQVAIMSEYEKYMGPIRKVADRFLAAYDERGRDPVEGWSHGEVEPFQPTPGEGSQTPPARDNQGEPLEAPDLGAMEIPGYAWDDKSKAFHSIGGKTASDRIASLQIELRWAADAVDRANELLREVADTLDARRNGEESISDTVGAAAKVTHALRAEVSPQLATLTRMLRTAL